jgi:hypothetical protein
LSQGLANLFAIAKDERLVCLHGKTYSIRNLSPSVYLSLEEPQRVDSCGHGDRSFSRHTRIIALLSL